MNIVEILLTYENGKMRPIETILKRRWRRIEENDGGVNLTKTYCKHFCKCHNVLTVQQWYAYNNKIKLKNKYWQW
jgi:hypothetical protein